MQPHKCHELLYGIGQRDLDLYLSQGTSKHAYVLVSTRLTDRASLSQVGRSGMVSRRATCSRLLHWTLPARATAFICYDRTLRQRGYSSRRIWHLSMLSDCLCWCAVRWPCRSDKYAIGAGPGYSAECCLAGHHAHIDVMRPV